MAVENSECSDVTMSSSVRWLTSQRFTASGYRLRRRRSSDSRFITGKKQLNGTSREHSSAKPVTVTCAAGVVSDTENSGAAVKSPKNVTATAFERWKKCSGHKPQQQFISQITPSYFLKPERGQNVKGDDSGVILRHRNVTANALAVSDCNGACNDRRRHNHIDNPCKLSRRRSMVAGTLRWLAQSQQELPVTDEGMSCKQPTDSNSNVDINHQIQAESLRCRRWRSSDTKSTTSAGWKRRSFPGGIICPIPTANETGSKNEGVLDSSRSSLHFRSSRADRAATTVYSRSPGFNNYPLLSVVHSSIVDHQRAKSTDIVAASTHVLSSGLAGKPASTQMLLQLNVDSVGGENLRHWHSNAYCQQQQQRQLASRNSGGAMEPKDRVDPAITTAFDDDQGITQMSSSEALRVASASGQTYLVRQLLCQQTLCDRDHNGQTALHQAAINNHPDIVQLLARYNFALLEVKDITGRTALHYAALHGHVDVVSILLQIGSHVDRRCSDDLGNSSIHLAASQGFSQTLHQLIKYEANVQLCNKENASALHLAAQNGHNQTARILLFAGCNPNLRNSYGDTALHTASRYGHAGVACILVNARCKVNVTNKNGDTALHICAALKRKKITSILLEASIDTAIKNKQAETAMDIAKRKEHGEIVGLLDPKVVKAKRKNHGDVRIHSSVEILTTPSTSPPEVAKKKSKFLSFFSRKKSQKNATPTCSEVTSPIEETFKRDFPLPPPPPFPAALSRDHFCDPPMAIQMKQLEMLAAECEMQKESVRSKAHKGEPVLSTFQPIFPLSKYHINATPVYYYNNSRCPRIQHQTSIDASPTFDGVYPKPCLTLAITSDVLPTSTADDDSPKLCLQRTAVISNGQDFTLHRCRSDDTLSTLSAAVDPNNDVLYTSSNRHPAWWQ